jgi:GT2 family glycosyltransferase
VEVSVIIPTFGRAAKLAGCLAHLARQDFDPARFEVLVGLDGGSEGETEAAREAARASEMKHVDVRWFEHAGPGVTRNRIVERARGELLLLLNDDVLPEPDLIRRHVEAHRERGVAMILGAAPWVVHEDDTVFDRLVRETSMIFFYDRMEAALASGSAGAEHDWGFRHAWTLNLSLPRAVFARVNGFNPRLRHAMFEDLEFAFRAARSATPGVPVLYRPTAIARHDHRIGVRDYLARERKLGVAAWELAGASPECAHAVFGRDIRSTAEVEQCRTFVEQERSRADEMRGVMAGWEQTPSGEIAGANAQETIKCMYESHLILKRWTWRTGLLEAAGESAA